MKVAWRTTALGITAIVSAETRGKARSITHWSATLLDHRLKWLSVRVVRAPYLDEWAEQDSSNHPWDEADLRGCENQVKR